MNSIPTPTISRLCALYQLLSQMNLQNHLSSKEIGQILGVPAHSIRKDISYLGVAGNSGAGYDVHKLRGLIADSLGLNTFEGFVWWAGPNGFCYSELSTGGSSTGAGFDQDNDWTLKTSVELFPAYG